MVKFTRAAMAACALLFAAPAFAQQAYPLACRGGGDMRITISPRTAYGGLVRSPADCERRAGAPLDCRLTRMTWLEATDVTIHFAHAPQAGAVASPGPGQCAWLDRPMHANEASILAFELPGQSPNQELAPVFTARGNANFRLERLNGATRDNDPWVLQLNTILDAMDRGERFTVYAHSLDSGTLRLTAVSLNADGPN
ncbi:MAG: hypothetical protein IV086_18995 [Hyphomonadaceae bacterium]|nr:MAG: hypothetical protein FD160_2797 [Caulobacteraceae bacterium]MBT9447786.1 hypothetical protein [Hyphomonadaceae bacterium]